MDRTILQELNVFQSLHKNSLAMIVEDDGMMPTYSIGDYIAGVICCMPTTIQTLIGQNCIIQTEKNILIFRRIKRYTGDNTFDLICTNPNTNISKPTLYQEPVISVAPVLWHRKLGRKL